MGCSIGKYLRTKDIELAGYYDVDSAAAKEAAEFTRTESFDSLKQLADQSQIIFITTPDSFIIPVWEQLKELSLRNQIICHCSGALSSDSFSGRDSMSVSYEHLNKAFFTVEGQDAAVEAISGLFCSIGNEVCRIDGAKKAKYHAAASILSNQVIAVLDMGYTLLEDCGFTRAEAVRATGQLVMRNIENVLEAGCDGALTGPIERNDIETVKKHIACMQNDDSDDVSLYKMLGTKLANIAEKKNPDKDYTQMMELLRG